MVAAIGPFLVGEIAVAAASPRSKPRVGAFYVGFAGFLGFIGLRWVVETKAAASRIVQTMPTTTLATTVRVHRLLDRAACAASGSASSPTRRRSIAFVMWWIGWGAPRG